MLALMTRCFSHYSRQAWGGGASAGFPALSPPEARTGAAPCRRRAPIRCSALNTSTTESPDLYDLQYTPRFAYVPELTGTFPSGIERRRSGSRPSGRSSSSGSPSGPVAAPPTSTPAWARRR